jgi:hypothetical protein
MSRGETVHIQPHAGLIRVGNLPLLHEGGLKTWAKAHKP